METLCGVAFYIALHERRVRFQGFLRLVYWDVSLVHKPRETIQRFIGALDSWTQSARCSTFTITGIPL